jgi:N,N'-diacetylchitobiose transport system substrate-binding protein
MVSRRVLPASSIALSVAIVLGTGPTAIAQARPAGAHDRSTAVEAAKSSGQLTVWMMDGDLSNKTLTDVSRRFKAETGVTPNVQIQQWANINTKLITTLSESSPPDVVDMGNTDVPLFAASGGLMNLTADKAMLEHGQDWLAGLAGPATINGRLFAVPLFAGNRAVIYNKKMWAAAGVTKVPTTWKQFTSDLDAVKAKNSSSSFSALYLPGEDWQTSLGFLFDTGARIATESHGKWTATLGSPAAIKGFTQFKAFQNKYSDQASRTGTEYVPDPVQLFGQGHTATLMNVNLIPSQIIQKFPAMRGNIGTFPCPSPNHPGKLMPVFLGGSDVGIATHSHNQALALKYVALLASNAVQEHDVVGTDGWTPISTQLVRATEKTLTPLQRPFFEAAQDSVPTPSTPGWATVESDLLMENLFGDVATGRLSIPAATSSADAKITAALNGQGT